MNASAAPVLDGGVLEESADGKPQLRFERPLRHSPERVWKALTEKDGLAAWFPAEMIYEPRVGSTIEFRFANGMDTPDGELLEYDPPRVLAFTWHWTQLRFEIKPGADDGCLLVLTQQLADVDVPKNAAGWTVCFERLDAALNEDPSDGPSENRWLDVYGPYARSMAWKHGEVDTSGAEPTLRFQRHFPHSVDSVWGALTEPDQLVKWLAEADIDLTTGGEVQLRWLNSEEEGEGSVLNGTITELDPPNVLEIDSDVFGLLRWELKQDGMGCLLSLASTPPEGSPIMSFLSGWTVHFEHLYDSLDGGSVDWPNWWKDYGDHYAEIEKSYETTTTSTA